MSHLYKSRTKGETMRIATSDMDKIGQNSLRVIQPYYNIGKFIFYRDKRAEDP